jgi:hypothetical protein
LTSRVSYYLKSFVLFGESDFIQMNFNFVSTF